MMAAAEQSYPRKMPWVFDVGGSERSKGRPRSSLFSNDLQAAPDFLVHSRAGAGWRLRPAISNCAHHLFGDNFVLCNWLRLRAVASFGGRQLPDLE
jgi:hypothetical protein